MFGWQTESELIIPEKVDEEICKPAVPAPPSSFEEWLVREALSDWPLPVASEGELNLTPEFVGLGSKQDIINDLAKSAPLQMNIIDGIVEQVEELERKLFKYADQIIVLKKYSNEEELQEDDSGSDTETVSSLGCGTKRIKDKGDTFRSFRHRTVEHVTFAGFQHYELTPLPGALEAPQLLNKITNIQHFHGNFKRLWKRYFLSESSVALFQDTFWWVFLDRYQPNEDAQSNLFHRIADNFVSLFLSLPVENKDRYFQKYADCLAQAVYAAFCECFPMSFKLFDDGFRSDLYNLLSEWITGVRPPPNSWFSWQLDRLETEQIRSLQEDRTQQIKSHLSFNPDEFLDIDAFDNGLERDGTFANITQSKVGFRKEQKESHQAGPGPDYEKVNFHIHGRSPLISHFLASKRLQLEEPGSVKKTVRRTEISKLPSPFPTYQDLIQERKRNAKTATRRYQRQLDMSAEERQQIDAQSRKTVKEMKKLEDELLTKNCDTKLLIEKVDELMAGTNYDHRRLSSSLPGDDAETYDEISSDEGDDIYY